ncbi:FAD-dependent oxidoreductase [Actinomadura scrupuli]|uniref:FAD-dependent oxidoreductase n=1 Tax=Actinomadura scrupuli TaxID=559629 RepID=UPI003D95C65F
MRVLIVGAGVGGLAAAQGLVADGHDVTVFERAPALPRGGAAVTIWPGGGTALAGLGLTLVGAGRRIHTLEVRSSTGRPAATVGLAELTGRPGAPVVALPLRLLLDRLSADLPAEVVRFRTRFVGLSVTGERVVARFEDGSTTEGDLLIGADGRHSAVRAALGAGEPAVPTGRATWQGLSPVPIDLTDGRLAVTITGPEGDCGLMPAGEGLLHWWFDVPWTPGEAPPAAPVAELRRRFGGWADPLPQVLAALRDEDAELFPHHPHRAPGGRAQDVQGQPGQRLCTLVGDSVATTPPVPAQGASEALEDAWQLVRSLRTAPADVPRALRGYEQARRSRPARISWPPTRATARREDSLKIFGRIPESFAAWGHGAFFKAVGDHPAT